MLLIERNGTVVFTDIQKVIIIHQQLLKLGDKCICMVIIIITSGFKIIYRPYIHTCMRIYTYSTNA